MPSMQLRVGAPDHRATSTVPELQEHEVGQGGGEGTNGEEGQKGEGIKKTG